MPPVLPLDDPASAFIEAACVPRDAHQFGTLEEAEMILARYPDVATSSIYAAALVADEPTARMFLARNPASATNGGLRGWDALTHLCFSRYLRIDLARSDAFVHTARALLDAGASASTGWIEMIDHPQSPPRARSRNLRRGGDRTTSRPDTVAARAWCRPQR